MNKTGRDADAGNAERLAWAARAPENAFLLSRRWHIPYDGPIARNRASARLGAMPFPSVGPAPLLRLLLLLPLFVFTASFAPPGTLERQPLDVVFFGDSVALGHGASAPERGFSSIIVQRLDGNGFGTQSRTVISALGGVYVDLVQAPEVVNASSGLVVVEVGAHSVIENQAMPLSTYRDAYGLMLDCLQRSGAALVVGTVPSLNWAPGNPMYIRADEISDVVRDEARSRGIAVADLWDATRDRPELVSDDGMHPGDAGHQVIANRFWEQIQPLMKQPRHGSATSCDYSIGEIRRLLS